ncbi:MAG: spermidine/putrescine ABC transporter substrate-binding protein [Nanoarchaeota archaeon]|nr:spermidine/putrescine ABC transporter substrate-binding protein [Nanoarchaeota archaeon]MCK5629174.1 spermidine/putrescine ABC transporter substrate-binding protein [Nanoarchaeota archaeon]
MKHIIIAAMLLVLIILAGCSTNTPVNQESTELNIVAWIGYDEESLIKPFEEKYDVKVNVKTAVGDPNVVSLLEQSPDTYDLIVVGPETVPKLHAKDLLQPVEKSNYPVDQFIEPLNNFPFMEIDGNTYAIPVRWGSNGLLYNPKYLSADDVQSYEILWDEKVKGKVGIWDYYIPSMGVISRYNGNEKAHDISDKKLEELAQTLYSLKPQVKTILANGADVHTALANEEVWVVPGGGEWNIAVLKEQGYDIAWTVPKEGGLMWAESISIVKGAKNKDLAEKFIEYITSPEGQTIIAWREAYIGIPAHKEAFSMLSVEQQNIMQAHNANEGQELANQVTLRSLPIQQEEQDWLDIWQEFKAR